MKINVLFPIAVLTLVAASCDRTWIPIQEDNPYHNEVIPPAPKPDPDPVPDPVPDPDPEPEPDPYAEYTDFAGIGKISPVSIVEEPMSTFFRSYWPDGKLIPLKKGDKWQMFWCEATDVLTEADTPWPEDHVASLLKENVCYGKDAAGYQKIPDFNENGAWFIGVFPLDDAGNYVGFFHAESHWPGDGTAHKSIGVCYSSDYGKTWGDAAPILTQNHLKPATPAWTGLGDGCVIWDSANQRYICYYQGKAADGSNPLCMAVSYDRRGASGTWKKWDGEEFTLDGYDSETGLGGENVPIAVLKNVKGANPSVMWNTYLNKWIMAYASWSHAIYFSTSDDGIEWSFPKKVVGTATEPAWYPNMISEQGDLMGGQTIRIYYSHNQGSNGKRQIGCRTIIFD